MRRRGGWINKVRETCGKVTAGLDSTVEMTTRVSRLYNMCGNSMGFFLKYLFLQRSMSWTILLDSNVRASIKTFRMFFFFFCIVFFSIKE